MISMIYISYHNQCKRVRSYVSHYKPCKHWELMWVDQTRDPWCYCLVGPQTTSWKIILDQMAKKDNFSLDMFCLWFQKSGDLRKKRSGKLTHIVPLQRIHLALSASFVRCFFQIRRDDFERFQKRYRVFLTNLIVVSTCAGKLEQGRQPE